MPEGGSSPNRLKTKKARSSERAFLNRIQIGTAEFTHPAVRCAEPGLGRIED